MIFYKIVFEKGLSLGNIMSKLAEASPENMLHINIQRCASVWHNAERPCYCIQINCLLTTVSITW